MTTPTDRESVEQLARKLCAQESEIWEEAGGQNRRRWRHEAHTALQETDNG